MAESSKRGIAYETIVQQICAQYQFDGEPLYSRISLKGQPKRASTSRVSAGCSHGCDLCLHVHGRMIGVEVKNLRATECGQRSLHVLSSADGTPYLGLPESAHVHARALGNHVPFDGRVPKFLSATSATQRRQFWQEEKAQFTDETLVCESRSIIREYYAAQGALYIQLEGLGLYRTTEDDPLQTGVPLFECQAKVRIRCKRHGKKGEPPRSIQVSLVLFAKKKIAASPFSIDSCSTVPSSFRQIAGSPVELAPTGSSSKIRESPTSSSSGLAPTGSSSKVSNPLPS